MRRNRSIVSLLAGVFIVLIGGLFTAVPGAGAQSDTLTIPAHTVIRGNAGDVVELGRLSVDLSLVARCAPGRPP